MPTMRDELRQVLGKPAKLNKDGETVAEQYAAINFNVRLDSKAQHKAVALLNNLLGNPKVVITVEPEQPRIEDALTEDDLKDISEEDGDEDAEPVPLQFTGKGMTPAEPE